MQDLQDKANIHMVLIFRREPSEGVKMPVGRIYYTQLNKDIVKVQGHCHTTNTKFTDKATGSGYDRLAGALEGHTIDGVTSKDTDSGCNAWSSDTHYILQYI